MNEKFLLIDDLIVDHSSVNEDYLCIICNNIAQETLQCKEGHLACRDCFIKMIELKKECMTCRCEIKSIESLSKNRYLEKEIRKLKIYCPNSFTSGENGGKIIKDENGCNEITTIDSLETHLKNCDFKFIVCPNSYENCGKIRSKDYQQHLNNCEFKLLKCEYCNLEIYKKQYNQHIELECLDKFQLCNYCNQEFKRIEIDNHIKKECSLSEIQCTFINQGCNKLVLRKDLEDHLNSGHIGYAKLMIDQLSLKLQETNLTLKSVRSNYKEMKKSKHYNNKWIIENWSQKIKDYGKGQFIQLPKFSISSNKQFSLKLFPLGEYDSATLSIHLIKQFNYKSRISFSFEIENRDPNLNEEEESSFLFGKYNDFYSTSFYNKHYDEEHGFINNDCLVINFSIEVLKFYDDSFITK